MQAQTLSFLSTHCVCAVINTLSNMYKQTIRLSLCSLGNHTQERAKTCIGQKRVVNQIKRPLFLLLLDFSCCFTFTLDAQVAFFLRYSPRLLPRFRARGCARALGKLLLSPFAADGCNPAKPQQHAQFPEPLR